MSTGPRLRRLAVGLVLLGTAGLLAAGHGRWWRLPDRHNPFAPLSVQEEPGWLTRYKLARLSADPAACQAFIDTTPLQAQPQPDRVTGPGCQLIHTLLVRRSQVQVGEPFTLTCRAAASLALWERHVLQPAAQAHFGQPVVRLVHFGSYACRNVYGRADDARSQHATADALDVAGFVLQGGRRISVAADWPGDDPASLFLRQVHGGACGLFDGVLGPDYNAAHADHFHLDRGPYRLCR